MEYPEARLAEFLAKYTPEVAACSGEAIARMRARLPQADALA